MDITPDNGPRPSTVSRKKRVLRPRKRPDGGSEAEADRETLEPEAASDQEGEQLGQEQPAPHNAPSATRELKLRIPEFKGKKGRDPQVHIQAFENWATLRELPRSEWRKCFPQTLRGVAQTWYFNYPPEQLPTYTAISKALAQRFKDEKSDEKLLIQLGNLKQKKKGVRQFVEEIKDLARQLSSPPGRNSLRAWFLNGTSLKEVAKAEITNSTRNFDELIQRSLKLWKGRR